MAKAKKSADAIETGDRRFGRACSLPVQAVPRAIAATEEREFVPTPAEVIEEAPLDARFLRSYFFVPFTDGHLDAGSSKSYDQSVEDLKKFVASPPDGRPFTDLIVMAHGWHRNLFSSIAAYDRLCAIFIDLRARGKLHDLRPNDFNPLLVGVHYHSDTGEDAWIDFLGRRDLESFLTLVRTRIEPKGDPPKPEACLTSVFEEAYDLFSRLAAPGVNVDDAPIEAAARKLGRALEGFGLIDNPSATPVDVLTVAWACYHEAEVLPQTVEQSSDEGRFVSGPEWALTLVPLALVVIAMTTGYATVGMRVAKDLFTDAFAYRGFEAWYGTAFSWAWPTTVIIGLLLALWILLHVAVRIPKVLDGIVAWWHRRSDKDSLVPLSRQNRRRMQNAGTRFWVTVFYLPLQVVHMAPILLVCFVTPFFASFVGVLAAAGLVYWIAVSKTGDVESAALPALVVGLVGFAFFAASRFGYLSERVELDKDGKPKKTLLNTWFFAGFLRHALVEFARAPIRVAKRAARPEQAWIGVWQTVENLLAFWDMAHKAVLAGGHVGRYIETVAKGTGLRVHLIAHSHGGLVVCNAARYLCRKRQEDGQVSKDPDPELQSVTTINGAYRSDWFAKQPEVTGSVTGCIASLYSRYDTANKLWYPLANLGRKSSGSVGLWLSEEEAVRVNPLPSVSIGNARFQDKPHCMNSDKDDPLQRVPDLVGRIEKVTTTDPAKVKVLNIDASRFVFKGPYLPQGAHGEIYSKDVVASLWRVLLFSEWRRDQG